MIVPVLWATHDDGMARGYADMGLWEKILDRTLWTPPDAIEFEHVEVHGGPFPDVAGAVVVLPARHNCAPEHVEWFVGELDRLAWSVVLLAGDEGREFPWRRVEETDRRRVWIMQPFPEHADVSGLLPGGWYPDTREGVRGASSWDDRPLDWFFAGQVTHRRRRECAEALAGLPGGVLHATDRYFDTSGLAQRDYFHRLAQAKVVPCPSGPLSVDTARAFEAMEAGCVPLLDVRSPEEEPFDYWSMVLGDDFPAPRVEDWSTLPALVADNAARWPGSANPTWAAWQLWKRRIARQLDADVRAVAREPVDPTALAGRLTAIVTTSPIPSHPSTAVIEETVASIRDRLPDVDVLVAVDGCRPEQADRQQAYDEYVRRLLWLCNFEWRNVAPVLAPEWGHQANSVRGALEHVDTRLILFVEHDTPLVGDVDWDGVCRVVESGAMNAVRFHHETSILDVHRSMMVDPDESIVVDGVPLRRSAQWWQRPHVASTAFYRDRIMAYFPPESRTMIEDRVYGYCAVAWEDRGVDGWDDWRVAIYAPDGDIKRSTHLDGRAGAPKFDMRFS